MTQTDNKPDSRASTIHGRIGQKHFYLHTRCHQTEGPSGGPTRQGQGQCSLTVSTRNHLCLESRSHSSKLEPSPASTERGVCGGGAGRAASDGDQKPLPQRRHEDQSLGGKGVILP